MSTVTSTFTSASATDVASSGEPVQPVTRQCGRCRHHFPADAGMHPMALREWWVCEPCHDALFGTAGFGRSAQHGTARS
jgi:hypothetical protein